MTDYYFNRYVLAITDPSAGTERGTHHFPTTSYTFVKDVAEEVYEKLQDEAGDEGVEVRNEQGDTCFIITPCYESGCGQTVRYAPRLRARQDYGAPCAGCDRMFCPDHTWDTDDHGDDGSGQYVTCLPDYFCQSCIDQMHEPYEY